MANNDEHLSESIRNMFKGLQETIAELRQYVTSQSVEIAIKNRRIAELEKQLQKKGK